MKRILSFLLILSLLGSLSACGMGGDSSAGDISAGGSVSAEASASASSEEETEETQESGSEETAKAFGVGYYKGEGINPYTCDSAQNQTIVGLVYDSLFELDETFTAQPCLAKSVTAETKTVTETVEDEGDGSTSAEGSGSADGSGSAEPEVKTVKTSVTVVTVTLRDDVNFTDGSGFHADDVAASLQRAAKKDSIYYNRLSGISDIETSGKTKVTFTLKGSNVNVAELLDIPIVKEETVNDLFPVGTGAYTVERNKKGLPTALNANEHWWRISADGAGQPVQTIQVYTAEDSDDLLFGFNSGSVTVVSTDFTGTDALSYTGSYTIFDYDTTALLYLGCNTDKASPCHDQQLRYAIYRSVDRDTIVSRQLAGHATAAPLPVPSASALYSETLAEELDYQLDTAKSLCSAVGTDSTLRLIVNEDSSFKVGVAKEAAKQLNAAGLSVEVEVLSWKEFRIAVKKGDYDLYLGEVKLNANFDLSSLVAKGGSLNYSGYSNSTLQKALKAFNCTTGEKRTAAAETWFTALAEQAPVVPLCFKCRSVLAREGSVIREASTQSNLFYHFWEWNISSAVTEKSSAE